MNILELFGKHYPIKKIDKFFNKGYAAFEKGNYQQAVNDFLTSLTMLEKADIDEAKKDEWLANTLSILAHTRGKIGQFELAEEDIKRALVLKQNDPELYWCLGSLKLDQNKYKEGIPIFEKMIELNPLNPNGHFFRGVCMQELGRYEESIPNLEKALELGSNDNETVVNTLVGLGYAYQELKEFKKAIEFFDKAISIDNKNSGAFVNRGNCKIDLGLNDEGCKDYYIALELGDTRVQKNIDEYCKNNKFAIKHQKTEIKT